ncbi:hypothetical protein [Pseudarthrobacter sp. NIBRBAC000502770]|uniref:hypothetical protein n=1 Tax=Pseudarthrobacter sp. NIBRBAC000502770 TaxID=2590785 RepID=UPI0011401C5B|nr:hypothetical protein [Pseudarthrobacter sp. NIBRBAC000502770]QDG89052.1 hypothetical protein NIBR502770_11605 [Pseudarthrobacter sp. NIBRBAC000502770]
MHPLAAIGLVFLTGLGWMATTLILLVALARAKPKRTHLTGTGPTAGDEMSHQAENVQELTSPLQGTQP